MRFIADEIRAHLTLRVFLPLLAIALATTWYGLGPSLDRIVALTGARFVDMQPGIDAASLIEQLGRYSPETVRFYLGWLAFDFAWPFLTYTTMLFMTAWLLRFVSPAWQQRLWWFVAVAYTTVLMDWAENAGFAILAANPPADPLRIAQLALLCHWGKLTFNMIYNAGFFALLIAAGASALRQRLAAR